jgi:hypothetical protein
MFTPILIPRHLLPILLPLLLLLLSAHSYDRDLGFDVDAGVRICSSSRGKLAPSLEDALTSCKHTDDCDHGTRVRIVFSLRYFSVDLNGLLA